MKLNKILNKDVNMVRKGKELIYESELRRSVSGIAALRLQFTNLLSYSSLFSFLAKILRKNPLLEP